jgi:hypothetical protein
MQLSDRLREMEGHGISHALMTLRTDRLLAAEASFLGGIHRNQQEDRISVLSRSIT